jgi:hypothetical protein
MGVLHPTLIVIAAGTLLCVFARAALHKASDFSWFAHNLGAYRLLPATASVPAAAALLVLEALVVFGLIFPQTRPVAALLGLLLLALYAAAIAINLLRGNTRIDCGCGGAGQGLSWFLVARNAALCGLAAITMATPLPVPMGAWDWTSAAAGVATFMLLLASVEKLIDNWSWLIAANESHRHAHDHHEGHH